MQSARLLLDSPDFADQVIPDLARWEDWSVLDRLVEMYVKTDELGYQKFVREPIVTYLDVAAEQEGELADRRARGAQASGGSGPGGVQTAAEFAGVWIFGDGAVEEQSGGTESGRRERER